MTTIKGSKKIGAEIKQTKTWGFHVIDHKNKIKNRPVSSLFENISEAEKLYDRILAGEKINYEV